jgi:SNF2-related domain/Helicase conserved C-terminal domain
MPLAHYLSRFTKVALVKTPLLEHQQRVVDRLQQPDQPGLVAIHGLGSGKTLTSIAAQEALHVPSQVVAPAALLGNYRKERAKHLSGKTQHATMTSMQNMASKGKAPDAPMLIVDEAHRARDPSSATFRTLKENTSQKRLLLSGSPFYNHPSDIAPLIDLAADAKVLPYDKDEFTRRYIGEKVVKPGIGQRMANVFRSEEDKVKPGTVPVLYQRNAPELRDAFAKWVDYHPGSTENFPEVEHQNVEVPMSSKQLQVYDTLIGKAPAWVAAKVKRGLPPNKREAQQLNAFLTAPRQVANSTAPFVEEGQPSESPKIQAAFEHMQKMLKENPRGKGVVYSNYLGAGIDPYRARLQAAGIPFGEFTGAQSSKVRDQLVKDYNEDKIRALLLSSAGGEGLDLKGTRLMQILEPHWNQEKLRQVEGRGARYMSHADLPPEERKVLIENYLSTRPQGVFSRAAQGLLGRKPDQSVDQYLARMSQDKEDLIDQFRGLLPQEKPQTKSAATRLPATAESRELASSWKPWLASEATYALPAAVAGASLGSNFGARGALIGGGLGAGMGHFLASAQRSDLVRSGKQMAREATRKAGKENALREGAEKLDWGHIGESALGHAMAFAPNAVMEAVVPGSMGSRLSRQLAAASIASGAVGAMGSGYLDRYRRQIAVNELDNAHREDDAAAAGKLNRLRRQVSDLEDRVEGDGWRVRAEHKDVPPVKDKKGKDW